MPTLSLPPLRGNFVLVRADGLRLLFPQEQVGAAGYLEGRPEPGAEPGLLRLPSESEEQSYAALSSEMTLLPECPPERFVVTRLGDGAGGIGWCWNELQVLIGIELQPRPLPACLVAPTTPALSYVEHGGELAFVCDAQRLHDFALARRS
ncbi:MAG: hypothetical protein ABIR26_06150 [Ramlibacter sp.]